MVMVRHILTEQLDPGGDADRPGDSGDLWRRDRHRESFRVNGIGALLIRSIQNSDTPVVMTITFIFACLVVFFNMVADIFYGVLDPRMRYS